MHFGDTIMQWSEQLAQFSEPFWAERGQLTVTYLTDAHLATGRSLSARMLEAGFDEVSTDAVGNIVGVYHGQSHSAPRLLTGSHYDTVRNGGKYDGRLGILVPIAAVHDLAQRKQRLPFGIEVIGFAEEEGQRYRATFLAASALTGAFDPAWLAQVDSDGVTMQQAMQHAGLPGTLEAIAALKRDPTKYLGFVEVHIEQGPVLCEGALPLGVVTSINAGIRATCKTIGMAAHAGTTPMLMRQDAMLVAAEISLMAEQRALADADSVATVGQFQIPGGSINVIPGECSFTLDMRAPTDQQRDALVSDILKQAQLIAERRQVKFEYTEVMRAAAAPSDLAWQQRWERAVAAVGLPVFKLNSGAGHDAMKLHTIMPQAMLFVRGGNRGISHNPLEIITSEDAELTVQAFIALLDDLVAQPSEL
jgi:N-carbamoyl-L-amino-acid hydrolase